MESKNSSLSEPEGGQSRAEAGRVLTPSEEDEEPCTWECLCRERLSAGLPGLPELGLATGWRSSGAATRAPGSLQEPVTGAQDSETGLRTVRTGAAEPVPSYPVPQGGWVRGCAGVSLARGPEGTLSLSLRIRFIPPPGSLHPGGGGGLLRQLHSERWRLCWGKVWGALGHRAGHEPRLWWPGCWFTEHGHCV